MTEPTPTHDPAVLWARIEAQHAERRRLAAEALPANKAALFGTLAKAGITAVVVAFDGCGDSGQIESVDARADGQPAALPTTAVEIATPGWDGAGLHRRTLPLPEAVEALAYAFLEEKHGGWENNSGAYGEFAFDVTERSITLDFNERIETSEYHGHEW